MFDKVSIELPNGNRFRIIAKNNSRKNKYILSVSLSGKLLNRHYITHEEIMSGGELIFEMSDMIKQY
jgi:putative alpha-1,2-mannosidase